MSGRKRTDLEKKVQREIEAAIGAEKDLLILKNSNGAAKYFNEDGKEYFVPYGLGAGSPDLVGMLRVSVSSLRRGRSIALWFCLEVKADEGAVDEDQRKCHAIWRRFGAFIEVVRSPDEARAALERARRLDFSEAA